MLPHFNSEWLENKKENFIRETCKEIKEKIYVLDDESAILVVDDKVKVISEWNYFVINE